MSDIFYLVQGDKIISVIDARDVGEGRAIVALPPLAGANAFSLYNAEHLKTLALNDGSDMTRAIEKMGLTANDAEVVASLEAVSVKLGVG